MAVAIFDRLLLDYGALDLLTLSETRKVFDWLMTNVLEKKIMTVEDWLTTAFHLCKQRWDSSIDWLETLPVPKVLLMIEILNGHAKAQEAEMKKSARRGK